MADEMRGGEGTASTELWTRTREGAANGGDLRVPGLTVLYHPDLRRVGERTVLPGLTASPGRTQGDSVELSRHRPDFAAPGLAPPALAGSGAEGPRPLGDASLSRTPLRLRGEGGAVVVERGESRTRVRILVPSPAPPATSPAASGDIEQDLGPGESAHLPLDALEAGVVLLLSRRVVLLLHRLDPVTDRSTPRFGLVGESPALARVRRDVALTADLDVPLLLRGESGTGKELVARAVHGAGPRRQRPFVAVNMAAVPPSLAASELFGAERGAYTGAQRRREGLFQKAHGGTLFLDEIGEAPAEVQTLLLRALETAEVRPVGADRPVEVDVRVLSATDADLEAAIEAGRFRGPLLHRLSGYVIALPPLRQRREDFGRLFVHFLRRELAALGSEQLLIPGRRAWLPADLVALLAAWHWPGNVRQLANVVRQLVIANRGEDPARRFEGVGALLDRRETPPSSAAVPAGGGVAAAGAGAEGKRWERRPDAGRGRRRPSDLREEEVVAALRAHRFRPAAAADALGIPRSSIYDLIDRIPSLRKASELDRREIAAARERVGPSVEAMAADLEVSERALRRRMGELGLEP